MCEGESRAVSVALYVLIPCWKQPALMHESWSFPLTGTHTHTPCRRGQGPAAYPTPSSHTSRSLIVWGKSAPKVLFSIIPCVQKGTTHTLFVEQIRTSWRVEIPLGLLGKPSSSEMPPTSSILLLGITSGGDRNTRFGCNWSCLGGRKGRNKSTRSHQTFFLTRRCSPLGKYNAAKVASVSILPLHCNLGQPKRVCYPKLRTGWYSSFPQLYMHSTSCPESLIALQHWQR